LTTLEGLNIEKTYIFEATTM